jgi:tetratricopeptide (TPR) repeat protein
LNPPIDRDTELPAHFSARRLAAPELKTDPAAAKLVVRAEVRLAKDNPAGALEALEQAVKIDAELVFAWRALGSLYEERKDWAKATAAYRQVLQRDPKDAISLNNLAYILAVQEDNPKEALQLAERALMLAPRNAVIADTVGWTKYLLGDHAGAVKLLEQAAKALPRNVDVQFHAAAALAAVGRLQDAAAALKAAEALDPGIKERPDYQDVLKKIGKS